MHEGTRLDKPNEFDYLCLFDGKGFNYTSIKEDPAFVHMFEVSGPIQIPHQLLTITNINLDATKFH